MKALINGEWHGDLGADPGLLRQFRSAPKHAFRSWITTDGASGFRAEPNRYHLYVSYACPWANRTILYRKLKGLEGVISMSVLHPRWAGADGWWFAETPYSTRDHVACCETLYQVYQRAQPDFTGKVTVPVLWDRKDGAIVSNESGDIIRMLNSSFDQWADASVDFYPKDRRDEIEALNDLVLPKVSMGVYRAGFAGSQESYDNAVRDLFEALDILEDRLATRIFLLGDRVVETDWHLFMTLVRFDAVYNTALKCSIRRLIDFPALSAYTRRLYELPGVAETIKLDHVKMHYFDDLGIGNPRVVPAGPARDFRNAA